MRECEEKSVRNFVGRAETEKCGSSDPVVEPKKIEKKRRWKERHIFSTFFSVRQRGASVIRTVGGNGKA
jgi:hypothetical protein